jgi:uncharacterized protein
MAQKAAPFLSWDSDPYPVILNGGIYWVLDGYTTTSEYPYSENAGSVSVPQGSGLPSSYNYVRNSVKLVVNAYNGSMKFYAMDNDPILRTYEAAFPGMFTPGNEMPTNLQSHLRYPEDMFSVQASLYGRYHIENANDFYNANGAWTLSPTAGAGSPSQALSVTITTNAQNQPIGGSVSPMSPLYQVLKLPGRSSQSFNISDAYVPYNHGTTIQNLAAFMFGEYNSATGGPQLQVYTTQSGQTTLGPAQAESEIQQNPAVSQEISLLDQHGSNVLLGNILLVPVGNSMLYVRPLYVESSGNPQPQLRYVITVLGQNVQMAPTLSASLDALLNLPSSAQPTLPSAPSGSLPSATQQALNNLLNQAQADYEAAQQALTNGGPNALAQYQTQVNNMQQALQQALSLLNAGTPTSAPTSSTTTTTTPKKSAKA